MARKHKSVHSLVTRRKVRRDSAYKRGYNARWQRERDEYLRAHPLCVACEQRGVTTAATVVDHIVPHKRDALLFWDERNWQALCKTCHDKKTYAADGAMGLRCTAHVAHLKGGGVEFSPELIMDRPANAEREGEG